MTARDRLLIRNAQVLDVRTFSIKRLNILIVHDTIESLETCVELEPGCEAIDASGKIAIPGLINAHTHAHNNLTKGTADNWTLEDFRSFGLTLYHNRSAEDQYLSAAIGAIEMLKTGTTAAYDQFVAVPAHTEESIAAVIQAYVDVGLRAVLAPAISDMVFYRAVPGLIESLPADLCTKVEELRARPAAELVGIARETIRRWNGAAGGRITVATAPVIPVECSDALIRGCRDLGREYGVGLHTHLAETKIQAIASEHRWGKSIVSHLADEDVIGEAFVGGHGVWVGDEDMRRLAGSGAMVAHNPASNLKLGSGIAPIRELLDVGATVGIGCDGSMSSDNQNLFEAMRIAALSSKIRFAHRPERWIGAREVLRMATIDGARVLSMPHKLGAIEAGRKADIVLLNTDSPFLRPLNDAANALVYCETGADVDTVLVGGRVVVKEGRVTTVDESAIRSRAAEAAERLRTTAERRLGLARAIEPFLRAACATCASVSYPLNRYATAVP